MIILATAIPTDQFHADPLGIPVFPDVRPPHREAGIVDFRLGGMISRWIREGAIDPCSLTPTLFSPGVESAFPALVITGAGAFSELSAPGQERIIAGMTETLLRARYSLFAIAARDFKKDLTPPRDSAEIILRGLSHGCAIAGIHTGHTIRVHWDRPELETLIQELRRFRYHIPACRDWRIMPAPEEGIAEEEQ